MGETEEETRSVCVHVNVRPMWSTKSERKFMFYYFASVEGTDTKFQ